MRLPPRFAFAAFAVPVLSASFACEPPTPSDFSVVNCPDRTAFAPAVVVGDTVELQADGPEDARYLWSLRDAPDGAEETRPFPLGGGDERRTLLSMPVEGAYEVCFASDDVDGASGCCLLHAASDLTVRELTKNEITEVSDIVTLGTTLSAADGEVDGNLQLWLQLNQDTDIEVSLTLPDGVRSPYQISPQRYVGGGDGLVQLVAFFRAEEGPASGRPPAEGDRIAWHVQLMPLVVGNPVELDVPIVLAPRAINPNAPRIDDAILVRNAADDGWQIDILDGDGIDDIVQLKVGGWESSSWYSRVDDVGTADLANIELTPGQRIAIRPWAFGTNGARFGLPYTLNVP